MRHLISRISVGGALFLVGCGGTDGPAVSEITGKVTFDGQPIATGEILFMPADGKGRSDAGKIVDGSFKCQATPGMKTVRISATKELPEKAPDGLPNYVSYIPAKYNSSSELTADIQKSGKNELQFDLKSK